MFEHSRNVPIKGPKLTRPSIDVGVDEEAWMAFQRRWETFQRGSGISEEEAAAQLFECASTELSDLVLKMDQNITSRDIQEDDETSCACRYPCRKRSHSCRANEA